MYPELDLFTHSLMTKAVVTILVAGIGGLLLRGLWDWFERWFVRAVQSWRKQRSDPKQTILSIANEEAPHCPSCNGTMVKRKVRRGERAGEAFWGCSTYPDCRGTRAI